MSYNIDSINVITFDEVWMYRKDLRRLDRDLDGWPEGNFLAEHRTATADDQDRVRLESFNWHGEGSGTTWHTHMKRIAKAIHGRVEAIVVWEGGDSFTGLRIVDGVMTEPKVIMHLAP